MESKKDYDSPDILYYLICQFSKTDQKPKCFYCGREFSANMDGYSNMTIDHLVPKSQKGSNSIDNLVICCRSCNSSKGKNLFKDNDSLSDFKKKRAAIVQIDDEWVSKTLFGFAKLAEYPDYKSMRAKLISLMNNSDEFYNAKVYGKNQNWIEWKSKKRLWYYELYFFKIQPYFLIDNNELLDEEKKEQLLKNGYYYNFGMHKYLVPYCRAEEVYQAIYDEVIYINNLFDRR